MTTATSILDPWNDSSAAAPVSPTPPPTSVLDPWQPEQVSVSQTVPAVMARPVAGPKSILDPWQKPTAPAGSSVLPPWKSESTSTTTTAPAPTTPVPAQTQGLLSRLKSTVEGSNTFLGTHDAGDTWTNLFEHPIEYAEHAAGYAKNLINKPVVNITNAESSEFQKAHPVVAGASDFVSGLTTPTTLAIGGVAGPAGKAISEGLQIAGLSAKAAKVIPGLISLGFSYQQIAGAAKQVPEITDALNRGDINTAERLMTEAGLQATLGVVAGVHGARGVHSAVSEHMPARVEPGSPEISTTEEPAAPGGHAGGGSASAEELARPGRFVRVSRSGALTDLGKSPDVSLKPGEALYQVKSDGFELKDGQESPATKLAIQGYAKEVFPPRPAVQAIQTEQPVEAKLISAGASPREVADIFTGALKNSDYANAILDFQSKNQRSSAIAHGIAEEGAKIPEARREAITNYHEAAGNPALLAQREATSPDAVKEGYRTAQNLKPEEKEFQSKVAGLLDQRLEELQAARLVGEGRENYVPHQWEGETPTEDVETSLESPREFTHSPKDFLKHRIYATFHAGEQNGEVPITKDFAALSADYLKDSGNVLAQKSLVDNLKAGETNSGMPLVAKGGFVAGNGTIIPDRPRNLALSDVEAQSLLQSGKLTGLLKSGDVFSKSDPSTGEPQYFMKMNNYVETPLKSTTPMFLPINPREQSLLGVTDDPDQIQKMSPQQLKANSDAINKLVAAKKVALGKNGRLYDTQPTMVRVPLFAHPEIADHLNAVTEVYHPGTLARAGLRINSEMKQALLSLSPFHLVTEAGRNMQTLGPAKGLIGAGSAIYKSLFDPSWIDYNHLTPLQSDAIDDGVAVSSTNQFPGDYVSEGLSGGGRGALFNRFYDATVVKGLEKLGVPNSAADKVNLNRLFTERIFGPKGMISNLKMQAYGSLRPKIQEQMIREANPDWNNAQIQNAVTNGGFKTAAGREAARQTNNIYGGLNYAVLGRAMKTQAGLRGVLLAPDFLESSGRNIVDLASPYGGPLLRKFVEFNTTMWLGARAANYAIHAKPGMSVEERVKATHPETGLSVLAADGTSLFNIRTQLGDFEHFASSPLNFGLNRVPPIAKAGYSAIMGRDQFGRRITPEQRVGAVVKSVTPISLQSVGQQIAPGLFGNTGANEPTAAQVLEKSVGVGRQNVESPALKKAYEIENDRFVNAAPRTGQELENQKKRSQATDQLRVALASNDEPAIDKAESNLDALVDAGAITGKERRQSLIAARSSRLQTAFEHLEGPDALAVWSLSTPTEKEELYPLMVKKVRAFSKRYRQMSDDEKTTYKDQLDQFEAARDEE